MKLTGISGPRRSYEWMTEHSGTFTMPVSADNLVRTICTDDSSRVRPDILSELDGACKGGPPW